jgi:hypothetical protein
MHQQQFFINADWLTGPHVLQSWIKVVYHNPCLYWRSCSMYLHDHTRTYSSCRMETPARFFLHDNTKLKSSVKSW